MSDGSVNVIFVTAALAGENVDRLDQFFNFSLIRDPVERLMGDRSCRDCYYSGQELYNRHTHTPGTFHLLSMTESCLCPCVCVLGL